MKVIFLKKFTLIIACALIVFFSMFAVNTDKINVSKAYSTALKKTPIYSVQTEEDKLSISFDAAWGADKTRDIMEVCESYGVKATFFLVGFWADKYPEIVKEIYNRGFEIGIHSNTHPDMSRLSAAEIKEELTINIEIIKNIIGVTPTLFRAPFGYYNNKLLDICEDIGLYCIQWDVDSLDWKGLSASEIAARVTSKASNGSIILCHNNADNIVNAIKLIFEYFKTNKKQVVPIGELIYTDNYIINNNGIQIKQK